MTTESPYPSVEIPNVDLWGFFFERKTPFPEDKGTVHESWTGIHYVNDVGVTQLSLSIMRPLDNTRTAT